jgi:hypothetical protein
MTISWREGTARTHNIFGLLHLDAKRAIFMRVESKSRGFSRGPKLFLPLNCPEHNEGQIWGQKFEAPKRFNATLKGFKAIKINFAQLWSSSILSADLASWNQKSKRCVLYEAYEVSIRCWDFDILLVHCYKDYFKRSSPLEKCRPGNEKPRVGAGTFCPLPILIFYILPCWEYLPVSGAGPSPWCYRKIP